MTREEVQLIFGVDSTGVVTGIDKVTGYMASWLEKAREMQSGYTGWWYQELAKRDEMQIASAAKAAKVEKEIWAGLTAEESALRLAAAKAQAAGQIAEYQKYSVAREAISAQITAFEETQAALRVAVAKAEATAQVAAFAKAAAARNAMSAFSSAKMSIGQQIANAERGGLTVTEEIAAGSIPAGMAGGAAKLEQEAQWAARLKAAGIEVEKGGHAMSTGARVWTESAVLMREGLRGNWSRMIGSFTILIGTIGSVVGVALAIVAAGDAVLELLGVNGIFRHARDYMKARSEAAQSEKDLKKKVEETSEMASTRVEGLEKAGVITKKQAEEMRNRLKENPTAEGVSGVLSDANRLMHGAGIKDFDQLEERPERNRILAEAAQKEKDDAREKMNDHDRQVADTNEWWDKKMKLGQDDGSLKYAQDKLEVARLEHLVDEDIAKAKEKAAAADKAATDQARERTKLVADAQLHADEIQQRHDESFMPTLQELAHASGRYGSQARRALLDEKRAKRDYERGDVAGAHAEIAARDKIYQSLSGAGIIAESPESREIRDLNKQLQIHFAAMPGTVKQPAWIKPTLK